MTEIEGEYRRIDETSVGPDEASTPHVDAGEQADTKHNRQDRQQSSFNRQQTDFSNAARERLNRFAWLLDSSIPIPGTKYSIGIEPFLGLIPGIGDTLGAGLSGYIILQGILMGVPFATVLRMVFNVVLEMLVGTVPFFGDLFDFVWKANEKNVALINEHCEQPQASKKSSNRWALIFIVIVVALLSMFLAFSLVLIIIIWQLLMHLIS